MYEFVGSCMALHGLYLFVWSFNVLNGIVGPCTVLFGNVWSWMVLRFLVWSCSCMVLYRLVWSSMILCSFVCFCVLLRFHIAFNDSLWSPTVFYGPAWSWMIRNCPVLTCTIMYGPVKSLMVLYSLACIMVQSFSFLVWFCMVLYECIISACYDTMGNITWQEGFLLPHHLFHSMSRVPASLRDNRARLTSSL